VSRGMWRQGWVGWVRSSACFPLGWAVYCGSEPLNSELCGGWQNVQVPQSLDNKSGEQAAFPAPLLIRLGINTPPLPSCLCCPCCRSVLVLAGRQLLGRVEEVFGPVTHPLYALRYGGPQPMPPEVAKDAQVRVWRGFGCGAGTGSQPGREK
jgi:hypothetical protein